MIQFNQGECLNGSFRVTNSLSLGCVCYICTSNTMCKTFLIHFFLIKGILKLVSLQVSFVGCGVETAGPIPIPKPPRGA